MHVLLRYNQECYLNQSATDRTPRKRITNVEPFNYNRIITEPKLNIKKI